MMLNFPIRASVKKDGERHYCSHCQEMAVWLRILLHWTLGAREQVRPSARFSSFGMLGAGLVGTRTAKRHTVEWTLLDRSC